MLLTITKHNSAYIYQHASLHMEYLEHGDTLLLLAMGYTAAYGSSNKDGSMTYKLLKVKTK